MIKKLLTGNEAIARGAYEAGVRVACAYPGTPSTEILENIAQYPEINAQWSTNEKVAVEVDSRRIPLKTTAGSVAVILKSVAVVL